MHAWREFVQDYLDEHRMTPADLARASGVSKQVLSKILNDPREQLSQRPDQDTVEKLAGAMGRHPDVLLVKVAEAMGLPTREVRVVDPDGITNVDLVRVLADRLLERKAVVGNGESSTAPISGDDEAPSGPPKGWSAVVTESETPPEPPPAGSTNRGTTDGSHRRGPGGQEPPAGP